MGKEVLIKERLSVLAEGSAASLKKYIDSFPDMQGFVNKDESAIKKFTAQYYLCARAITKDFDSISKLSDKVSALIKEATAAADEQTLSNALAVFEIIMDLTRAYESFLSDSEAVISGKNQVFSYAALHRSAVSFYTKLSSLF